MTICVDIGSTFTKAALVDLESGALVATAEHRTTTDTDVLDGVAACRQRLADLDARARDAELLACSSAGGGLRIAVVGNEELVTAEAGRRVALSSGGRVVHVASGGLPEPALRSLAESKPDVVLLVGGTDGGNADVLLASARALAGAQWTGPVVVAGNIDARDEVVRLLSRAGTPHVATANVVPRIGALEPEPARAAIREMFLRHVIGGKHLSRHEEFTAMVRGATPDVVLTAVELLARGLDADHPGTGDVAVVDVGGATTDVHTVVEVDPESTDAGAGRDVVATLPVSRTVEGDLGMRWSALPTVEQAAESGLVEGPALERLRAAARVRRQQPAYLPRKVEEHADDRALAALAVTVALRRHAGRARVVFGPDGRLVERTGKDLRRVRLVIGSGGVLRHAGQDAAALVRQALEAGEVGGWQLPHHPRVAVDARYVLAAAGLLAERSPAAAYRLLTSLRGTGSAVGTVP